MEIKNLFNGIYKDKICLVTGHTGFKGSWLVFWLKKMGANVIGYALPPVSSPNHYSLLNLSFDSVYGDINNYSYLKDVIDEYQPEIVFHLAAQALVRESYNKPKETFMTNVIGTINIFECVRESNSVKAIVNVTSDKCYENKEWVWGYRENDPMGGHDPYSASKGCSELVTASYQNSYFNSKTNKLLSSVRAGNVIGGGDWAKDRLIPDLMKAAYKKELTFIRSPFATRPWQHVLEPLSGYLQVGQYLLEGKREFAESWNFGPKLENNICVKKVAEVAKNYWSEINYKINLNESNLHEANLLMLDCSKAYKKLKWSPVWDKEKTFKKTINWYKDFYTKDILSTEENLFEYINDAYKKGIIWAKGIN